MRVLLLGSGGREHALAWKLSQSPKLKDLFIAPGNPGTTECGQNISLDILDAKAVAQFCLASHIDMVIIGPEEPLVRGVSDELKAHPGLDKLIVCGPGAIGAQLEGSKAFAKAFMDRHNIPTAGYRECQSQDMETVMAWLEEVAPPYVIKADGLAAGKGVIITSDKNEAEATIREMFSGRFGRAGHTVVLEEFLSGIEFSVFVLTDGKEFQVLPSAKDYKRIGEGDSGPNTGGMGAVSPVPFLDETLMAKVRERILIPTINGLASEGISYEGFIFFGLIRVGSDPFVIEYNCRMGDPETEVVMPRLKTDLLELLEAMGKQGLDKITVEETDEAAVTVMMVSEGYPGTYPKGRVINGIPADELVFHAGTSISPQGELVTNGGRVLACTAMGKGTEDCRKKAYDIVDQIYFEGANFRNDIGLDVL